MTLIITLSLFGLALIIAEVFVPGGVLGVIGFILLILASVSAYKSYDATWAIGLFFINLFLAAVLVITTFKLLWKTPYAKSMFLTGAVQGDSIGGRDDFHNLLGKQGKSLTRMSPTGVIEIGGKQYDAVSQSGLIAAKQTIEVVEDNRFRILVREVSNKKV